MERPGGKLRRSRERLKLTYREVQRASREIAARRGSSNFQITLSRLADIENQGGVPTIFRLYTLSAIYHLDLHELMRWYGVPVDQLAAHRLHVKLAETHLIEVTPEVRAAQAGEANQDWNIRQTTFLSRRSPLWGNFPLRFIDGARYTPCRDGLVGTEDWSMFAIFRPGAPPALDGSVD